MFTAQEEGHSGPALGSSELEVNRGRAMAPVPSSCSSSSEMGRVRPRPLGALSWVEARLLL